MAGVRSSNSEGRFRNRRFSGRPIPKRGQVKAGIVIGLAHSVAALFSLTGRRAASLGFQPSRSQF